MNVDARGREAAERLRAATSVDVEESLARLRRMRRQGDLVRVVAACAVVAAVALGSLVALERESSVPPADSPALGNGPIVAAGERQFGATPTLPRKSPYPLWQGVDPLSGSFLYASDSSVAIVDETGAAAEFLCPSQPCGLSPYPGRAAFGPGDGELTFTGPSRFGQPPRTLVIVGYDGDVREEVDLAGTALPDRSFRQITWSPDGRLLAVSMESPLGSRTGEVWVVPRDGGEARLLHREKAPQELVDGKYINTPVIADLAWSPDGSRLGMLTVPWYQGDPTLPADPSRPRPQLLEVDAEGRSVRTLHTFDHSQSGVVPSNFVRVWAFAWSPDGRRIAVTTENGVAEISATDGALLATHRSYGLQGPLAWLPR